MILHLETINTVEELRKKYNKAKLSENSPEVKIFIKNIGLDFKTYCLNKLNINQNNKGDRTFGELNLVEIYLPEFGYINFDKLLV